MLLSEDRTVYAYDAFYPLYNFWHCLLNDKEQLVKDVRNLHPLDKGGFKAARDLLRAYNPNIPLSPVAAAAYFAINRSSFSGATLSGGFSQQAADGRFNENSIKRLEDFEAPNLKVGYKSFEESIELHKNEFLYLDPPYFLGGKKDKLYGLHEYEAIERVWDENHEKIYKSDSMAKIFRTKEEAEEKEPVVWRQAFTTELLEEDEEV